jgi:hypothetical protein
MSPEPAAADLRRVTMLSVAVGLLLVIGGVVGLVYSRRALSASGA